MEINIKFLEQYLEDTFKKINAADEAGNLKMVRDMALGVVCFCHRAEIINEQNRDKYLDDLGKVYGEKWIELEKR